MVVAINLHGKSMHADFYFILENATKYSDDETIDCLLDKRYHRVLSKDSFVANHLAESVADAPQTEILAQDLLAYIAFSYGVSLNIPMKNFAEDIIVGQEMDGSVFSRFSQELQFFTQNRTLGLLKSKQWNLTKMLSAVSAEGVEEFRNEVIVIAKLQHQSLDAFLFGRMALSYGVSHMIVNRCSCRYSTSANSEREIKRRKKA